MAHTRPFEPAWPSIDRARAAGIFYLITFASSIPALALEHPVLNRAGFIVGDGPDTRLLLGSILDLINAAACVGTAVALYPELRERHASLALGFVTSRLAEAALAVTSVAAILSLVTLHEARAGADQASLLMAGRSLTAVHDWAFLLGPGLIPAVNAVLLGTVLYRTGLVPRVIPRIGLIGAPLLLASCAATIFGAWGQVSTPAGLLALPIAAWELSLGAWLIVRGFPPDR